MTLALISGAAALMFAGMFTHLVFAARGTVLMPLGAATLLLLGGAGLIAVVIVAVSTS